ncbi:MAG TPA: hypothetical protein VNZ50_04035 [Hyphomicrobiaceae bacterium]|nr:hypothetical protein [Hyphomicrobiaceae bacterium]
MADGSRSIEIEAEAAGAEAAREAKAEVLEREASKLPIPTGKRSQHVRRGKGDWHEFTVDVWITNLNSVEFGIFKHSRNRAKSRQFTLDMDVFAEVIENGERTGLIAYREDLWKKQEGMERRLVLRLFGDKLNWRATMDLMLARSLQLTIGARGIPVSAYSINTGEQVHNIYLERSANKWPLLPENFSFFVLDDHQPILYRLRRDMIDFGGDYTLYDAAGNVVGRLDGKVFSIGGKWHCRILREHADPRLLHVLKLFAAKQVFARDVRHHLKSLWRGVRAGRIIPKIDRQEADLYMNPRRMR